MDLAQLQRETKSSIELKINAKQEPAWDIKVYFEDGHEADALQTLDRIDASLRANYLSQ